MSTTETKNYAPRTVQSVGHAAALLREIAAAAAPPTLSLLARKLGLSKPATYNLVNTLIAERLVDKDADGRYSIAWAMYELGAAVSEAQAIRRAARGALHRLAEQTDASVLLSVLDRQSVLYIDREELSDGLRMTANTGRRSPLHTNASGKVLLANMDAVSVRQYLSCPLKPKTSATITDPRRLMNELVKAKDEGYGVCWGEHEPLLSSVAVPLITRDGVVRGSIAVAVTTARLKRISPSRLMARIRSAADEAALEYARLPVVNHSLIDKGVRS